MQTVLARISKITWKTEDNDLPTETDIMINVSDPDDEDDVIDTIKSELSDKYDNDVIEVDYWIDDDFCEDDCESDEDMALMHETED